MDAGGFELPEDRGEVLPPEVCAAFLDYQLAVTIDSDSGDSRTNEVFGRINSGGRRLSFQEQRQAGLVSPLSEIVRELSAELRGDTSPMRLPLLTMPEISINTPRDRQGYGISASDVVWCRHGIIGANELRDSVDEQLVADICISILLAHPLAVSREVLDTFYDPDSDEFRDINARLGVYGADRLKNEVKVCMSLFSSIFDDGRTMFRTLVHEKQANSARTAFYAVFFAIFDLVFKDGMKPERYDQIRRSLTNVHPKLNTATHHTTKEMRESNVNLVSGLIRPSFVKADVAELKSGAALAVDFENSLRMARFERNRYELKVGRVELDGGASISPDFYDKLCRIICGISNVGPEADGYVYFGVADKKSAADRIHQQFGIESPVVADQYFPGIEFELRLLGINVEAYVKDVIREIAKRPLSEPLKTHVISNLSHGQLRERTFVRLRVPAQADLSTFDGEYFIRKNSDTEKMTTPEAIAQTKLFAERRR